MIGSSVVPGLPNRCVMPSSLSSARKAERPVILFFIFPPGLPNIVEGGSMMAEVQGCAQGSAIMAALRGRASNLFAAQLERILAARALLLFRALPDHARKTRQRYQRLAGIGPFLELF